MGDEEFRAFLNLMMCSDPWPTHTGLDQELCDDLADREARKRGYRNWIEAYHEYEC